MKKVWMLPCNSYIHSKTPKQDKAQFLLGKDDLYGSLTYSLCQPNNQNMAQIYFGRHPEQGVVSLSSDGLRDCVGGSDEDFERVMRWIFQKNWKLNHSLHHNFLFGFQRFLSKEMVMISL